MNPQAEGKPNVSKPQTTFWTKKRRESFAGLILVAPEVIGIFLLAIFPLAFSLYLSFTEWNLVGGLGAIKFIGLDNFIHMFQDKLFLKALYNNIFFSVATVPVSIFISMLLSVIIHTKVHAKEYFKVAFFIPYICSTVAIAAVWAALFHPSKGPINQYLLQLGFDNPPKWLVDTTFALVAIMIIYVWQHIGYKIIIYIAGLSNIPDELYEAAGIDGATGMQQFWRITIPLLGPTTFFLTITSVIASFKVFDLIKFLTNGGPNNASTVLVYQIYEEGFLNFRMGYASAMSWVLFLIIAAVTSITWIVQSRKVHY